MERLVNQPEVLRALTAFGRPGEWFEIRILGAVRAGRATGPLSGAFVDSAAATTALVELARTLDGWEGCYVTPNPLRPDRLTVQAGRFVAATKSAGDADVIERRWILVDVDPERAKIELGGGRTSKAGASDAEKASAMAIRDRIVADLTAIGWPAPIVSDSGNGGHVMWHAPGLEDAAAQQLLRELAARYDTPEAKVDQRVHNRSRIWKLPGTLACKGPDLPDRPWRMARIEQLPEQLVAVAPERIAALARPAPPVPALPLAPRSEVAFKAFDDAKRAYVQGRSREYPAKPSFCPACGHNGCFHVLLGNPDRWVCWSSGHVAGCGIEGAGMVTGDALDLDAYAAGRTAKEHLIAEGYLEPYVERMADPAVADIAEAAAGLKAQRQAEAVARAEVRGKSPDVTRERKFVGSDEVRFESDSDVTLAIGLCEELEAGREAPVVGCEGTLWRYEAPRWRPLKAHEIENHVAAWEGEPVIGYKGEPVPLRLANGKIKSVVERAKTARAEPEFFRDVVGAVAFRNGMAVLRGGAVHVEAPSPDHRVRHVLELDYTDTPPVALFELFEGCFEGCEDAVERGLFLSEFVGACLAGVATRFEIATILLGHSANGKSTFLQHAVRPIFPQASVTSVSPQDMGREYNRATLVGSAINIVSEMPDGDILGAEAVKAIISGETVQARQIREAPFDLNCRAGHLFAANDLPALRDFSTGFQRRWQIIGWPNIFTVDNPRRRTDWGERLDAEMSQIASWYVRCAAAALHRARYTPVSSSDAEVWRWVHEADSVAVWIDSRCTRSSATTGSAKLYADYRTWVGSVGMKPVTIQKFGRRLTRLGVSSDHSRGGEVRGLLINHETP